MATNPGGLGELLRKLGGGQGGQAPSVPNQPAPVRPEQTPPPQSFRDTLSAILGRQVQTASLPSLAGSAGMTHPRFPSTILTTDERAGDRTVLAHELGHLIDFANILDSEDRVKGLLSSEGDEEERNRLIADRGIREAAHRLGLLREDPLVTERFANEFEGALLDPEVRGSEPDEVRRRLQELIDERLERFQRRQAQSTRIARDATAIR